jgi:hypothetical protein
MQINEVQNPNDIKQLKPIKERQDIFIPDITDENIPRRNGFIWVLAGSGGSGKTSLMLSMFKSKNYFRNKFHNIYYICPECSMDSVKEHPFATHDKVYNDLNVETLDMIYNQLIDNKPVEKKTKKINKKSNFDDDTIQNSDEYKEHEIEYSCLVVDDFADQLKNKFIQNYLKRFLVKTRHLKCAVIFTLQSYYLFPKLLRKMIHYATIFAPRNIEERISIGNELINLNKDDTLKLFDYVFDKPYNHLSIDTVDNKIYKNFNLLNITK